MLPVSYAVGGFDMLPFEMDVERFRALTRSAAGSERLRWWIAYPNPAINPKTGKGPNGTQADKYIREEQSGIEEFRALVQGEKAVRKLFPHGEVRTGDITVMTLPDELPLADNDWIMPVGRNSNDEGEVTGRTFRGKETLLRGNMDVAQAGLLFASATTAVTGQGTHFLTSVTAGGIVRAGGVAYRVASVTDDTHLTLETGANPTWGGYNWAIVRDRLLRPFVKRLVDVRDATTTYRIGTDVSLAPPLAPEYFGGLLWHSASRSPAVGAGISVTYDYSPRYVVREDLGVKRRIVNGMELPQTVVCRMDIPDSLKV